MNAPADPVIYGWLPQRQPPVLCIERAEEASLWDSSGRRFTDLCAGQMNVNAGYGHPHILSAMARQMAQLVYVPPNFATVPRSALAEKMLSHLPAALRHVFFTNSGSEAIEIAIKVARAVTGRTKIYSAWRSYHGTTAGAATLSGDPRRLFFEPGLAGVSRFHGSTCSSCAFGDRSPPECAWACLQSLRNSVVLEGPETIAAILLEPITGTSGVHPAQPEFLRGVRKLCDEYGILLIFDETITGWGRTGRWFACEHYGVTPDLMTTAKGITSAYVPLGALLMSARIRESFLDRPFVGGLTNEGHALACATAIANIEVLENEGLVRRAELFGEHLLARLKQMKARHPSIGDVRGKGLLACIELTADRASRTPLAGYRDERGNVSRELTARLLERGVLLIAKWDFVFLAPPLTIDNAQLDVALDHLDEVLSFTDTLVRSAAEMQRATEQA
jgi:taurine---2-oxoglutarate transaminase